MLYSGMIVIDFSANIFSGIIWKFIIAQVWVSFDMKSFLMLLKHSITYTNLIDIFNQYKFLYYPLLFFSVYIKSNSLY